MNHEYEPNEGFPTAQLAEEALLCCLMRYPAEFPGLLAADGIDAECFHIDRELYNQVTGYIAKFRPVDDIDLNHIIQEMELNGSLATAGGPAAIYNLISRGPVENHWRHYSAQAKEAKARRIALISAKKLGDALDSAEAIAATKATLDALVAAVSAKGQSKDAKTAGDDFISRWLRDHESGEIPGSSTGFHEIDAVSGGMRPGELWIVGAKSTRGKSVFMLQVASKFMERKENVAIFSLEMMSHEVTGRLVCVLGVTHYGAITQPRTANAHDKAGIMRGVKAFKDSNVWIEDSGTQTIDWIEAEAQRISDLNGGVGLVVVDYLQLIHAVHQKGVNREQEIARISKGLKQLAKRLGCPILTATQLNEEGRSRESKAIEQDADALLYIAEDGIKAVKMRNGKRDSVFSLYLHGHKQMFTSETPK